MAQHSLNSSEIIKTDFDIVTGTNYTFQTNFFRSNSIPVSNALPRDMKFNDGHLLAVIVGPLLMILSAIGNITVFVVIVRLRLKGKISRINLFLLHLSIADLLVTFLMMPLEIGWNATVSWQAGNFMCRFMSFFRIFGLYLSSFMLVGISLDRYVAVLKPLKNADANKRARILISSAWIASTVFSLPQSFIFHVEKHPKFKWYEQCVTFNSFPSRVVELFYNFFGFFFLYGFPLVMIIFCYSSILLKIYSVGSQNANGQELRRSNMETLVRAKTRMLKMTIIIVATFFVCWTPYNVISLSAQEVDPRVQKALFMFACVNSCVNPLIYGLFHFRRNNTTVTNTGSAPTSFRYRRERNWFNFLGIWKLGQCYGSKQTKDSSEAVRQANSLSRSGSVNMILLRTNETLSVLPDQEAGKMSPITQIMKYNTTPIESCQPSSSIQHAVVEHNGETDMNILRVTSHPWNHNTVVRKDIKVTCAVTTDNKFIIDALTTHNIHRAKHHSPPLALSEDLCRVAQAHVNQMAAKNSIDLVDVPFISFGYGEIRYKSTGPVNLGGEIVTFWHSGVEKYNFDLNDFRKTALQKPLHEQSGRKPRKWE
ncbi:Gonadotropin-releasing hormone II receptor [Orchesella cincta]|uniref:Gonadotropin-releasing hormone II receptor n=1 Tax=Orchesella cincta TaxID=48709 RepID=A0A1D2MJR5_ORCCI|nr:Gonadotropin-releasing hormone II receptor [Orchesella cincta]